MGATATVRKSDFIDAMEENQKDVRKMVMDSYHDIEKGCPLVVLEELKFLMVDDRIPTGAKLY